MAGQLVALREIEKLSPIVIRILGGNPGKFTLQGTNTYLIGRGNKRILLDTGEGYPAWHASLTAVLKSENATVDRCLLTHWHGDHTNGVPDLLKVASDVSIHKHDPSYLGPCSSESVLEQADGFGKWHHIANGHRFHTEGATLRAVHCPGHTTDHVAFVLEEEHAMFTGDNVLGQGTAVFENLSEYMKSLDIMARSFPIADEGRAYPGHGPVIEKGRAKVEEYIEHRKEREKQVLSVLETPVEGQTITAWTSMQIVKVVYADIPEELHIPAEGGVKQVLNKLQVDGKVTHNQKRNTWTLATGATL